MLLGGGGRVGELQSSATRVLATTADEADGADDEILGRNSDIDMHGSCHTHWNLRLRLLLGWFWWFGSTTLLLGFRRLAVEVVGGELDAVLGTVNGGVGGGDGLSIHRFHY